MRGHSELPQRRVPGREQSVGGFIPARWHQCRLCSCWAQPCPKPRISWSVKNRGIKYQEGKFHCLCYQLGRGGAGISTRRNLWSLHWNLSQLNREYWAVYKLQTAAILAHEYTGAWVVFSICWAAKPEGQAALSTTLSLTCQVQEKQHALQPRETAKFVFELQRFGAGSLQGEAGSSRFRWLFKMHEICVEFR